MEAGSSSSDSSNGCKPTVTEQLPSIPSLSFDWGEKFGSKLIDEEKPQGRADDGDDDSIREERLDIRIPDAVYYDEKIPAEKYDDKIPVDTSEDALNGRRQQHRQSGKPPSESESASASLRLSLSSMRKLGPRIKLPSTVRRGNYKPTALRWPFLVALMALLVAGIAAVGSLLASMPGTDNSAMVDGRPMRRGIVRRDGDLDAGLGVGLSLDGAGGSGTPALATTTTTTSRVVPVVLSGGGSTANGVIRGGGAWSGGAGQPVALPTNLPKDFFVVVPINRPSASVSSVQVASVLPVLTGLRGTGFKPSALVAVADPPPPLSPTSTAETAADPEETEDPDADGDGGGGFGIFGIPKKTKTTAAAEPTGSVGWTSTDPVVRWSTAYVDLNQPTTVVDGTDPATPTSKSKWGSGFGGVILDPEEEEGWDDYLTPAPTPTLPNGGGLGDPLPQIEVPTSVPASVTVDIIVGGTTSTVVVTPPPTTTVNSVGSTVVTTPPPETVVGVVGGTTTKSVKVDDGLTADTRTIVTTAASGSTVTLVAVSTPGKPVTETVTSVVGGTVSTVTPPPVTTVTDIGGGVLSTITLTPAPYVTTVGGQTTTFTRVTTPGRVITTVVPTTINGTPTTVPTVLTITPTPTTRWIVPTASPKGGADGIPGGRALPGISSWQYFLGTFMPTLLAICVTAPVAAVDLNAKLFQPFHALALADGADGPDSMTLRFTGLRAVFTSVSLFVRGHPVPLITTSLVWLSWLVAPLASEAIGFKVHGECDHLSIAGCGIAFGVSPAPAKALIAVMAAMLLLLAVLTIMLHRWETGLYSNPWSVAGIAALSLCDDLRAPLVRMRGDATTNLSNGVDPTEADLDALFAHGRFRLKLFHVPRADLDDLDARDPDVDSVLGEKERAAMGAAAWSIGNGGRAPRHRRRPSTDYGIVPLWGYGGDTASTIGMPSGCSVGTGTVLTECTALDKEKAHATPPRQVPFVALTYTGRGIFVTILVGIAVLLIYYHMLHEDNAFELFMDSQAFGVKFLFAAMGTCITFFWASFFQSEFFPDDVLFAMRPISGARMMGTAVLK